MSGSPAGKLVSKILKDSDEQTKMIIDEANVSSAGLREEKVTEIKEKAETNCEKILNAAKLEADNIIRRETVNAKIKTRLKILSQKRKFLDEVFKKAEQQFESSTKQEIYGKMLSSLIIEAATAAGGGNLEIFLNGSDVKRKLPVKEISKTVSSELGSDVNIVISKKTIDVVGGVLVQTADRKTKIDSTLEAILERSRKDLELKISEILFKDLVRK
ncbi:V-type ATP synthase subunit E [[Eubacterium] cellulosolvens]